MTVLYSFIHSQGFKTYNLHLCRNVKKCRFHLFRFPDYQKIIAKYK